MRWLAAAGGAQVAPVLAVDDERLVLPRIESHPPTPRAAAEFGAALAHTHAAGAESYGAAPDGWDGPGWYGPAHALLPLPLAPQPSWGSLAADVLWLPLAEHGHAAGVFSQDDVAAVHSLADRVREGAYDTQQPPARVHGDLWSGNLLWGPDGVVLIDPAAYGGHPEADLAMLHLFGAPYLDRIIDGYCSVAAPAAHWRARIGLHQLHPLLLHAVVFGGGYLGEVRSVLRRYR
ncbi:fructosamine kinase family protein [Dermacoccaceae bacterium W4C1]